VPPGSDVTQGGIEPALELREGRFNRLDTYPGANKNKEGTK
jgi:hypothetical protein